MTLGHRFKRGRLLRLLRRTSSSSRASCQRRRPTSSIRLLVRLLGLVTPLLPLSLAERVEIASTSVASCAPRSCEAVSSFWLRLLNRLFGKLRMEWPSRSATSDADTHRCGVGERGPMACENWSEILTSCSWKSFELGEPARL